MDYVKTERVKLKNNPEYSEKWVQDRIVEDASILGLGELVLRDRERLQPTAGRLDLLFQDAELETERYEVELQLGPTDESHIIRTIEYWDIERKRYPQYDHTAVIVAEDITSRFLNVIGLFNGFIPLIALQMRAYKFGDKIMLIFTRVIDRIDLGLIEEEEQAQEVDRSYWEKEKGTPSTVKMADEMLGIIKTFDSTLALKYNKFYIGLARNGQPDNFVIFRPKKNKLNVEIRMEQSEDITNELEAAGIEVLEYNKRNQRYKIGVKHAEIKKYEELLTKHFKRAYEKGNPEAA